MEAPPALTNPLRSCEKIIRRLSRLFVLRLIPISIRSTLLLSCQKALAVDLLYSSSSPIARPRGPDVLGVARKVSPVIVSGRWGHKVGRPRTVPSGAQLQGHNISSTARKAISSSADGTKGRKRLAPCFLFIHSSSPPAQQQQATNILAFSCHPPTTIMRTTTTASHSIIVVLVVLACCCGRAQGENATEIDRSACPSPTNTERCPLLMAQVVPSLEYVCYILLLLLLHIIRARYFARSSPSSLLARSNLRLVVLPAYLTLFACVASFSRSLARSCSRCPCFSFCNGVLLRTCAGQSVLLSQCPEDQERVSGCVHEDRGSVPGGGGVWIPIGNTDNNNDDGNSTITNEEGGDENNNSTNSTGTSVRAAYLSTAPRRMTKHRHRRRHRAFGSAPPRL